MRKQWVVKKSVRAMRIPRMPRFRPFLRLGQLVLFFVFFVFFFFVFFFFFIFWRWRVRYCVAGGTRYFLSYESDCGARVAGCGSDCIDGKESRDVGM